MAAKSDAEHYAKEREREKREVAEIPHEEMREVAEVFQAYGLSEDETWPIVQALKRQPRNWVDFMMRFELGLEKPEPGRPHQCADDRGSVHCRRRLSSAGALLFLGHDVHGFVVFSCVHARGVAGFWFCKGSLHRNASGQKRAPDGSDR